MRQRGVAMGLSLIVAACGAVPDGESLGEQSGSIVNGTDDRFNISQTSTTVRELSKAVFGVLHRSKVVQNADGTYHLDDSPIQSNLCAGERFAGERAKAQCTAWLIAPDLAATAAHCLTEYTSIDIVRFVLGFDDSSPYAPNYANIPAENVFTATAEVYRSFDTMVVRLDHPAPATAKPFRISSLDLATAGIPQNQIAVTAIGAQLGLPLKYSAAGTIRSVDGTPPFVSFDTSLDMVAGNSGSPVLDATTNLAYGVFNSGSQDLTWDPAQGCNRWAVCDPIYSYCREIAQPMLPVRPLTLPAGAPLDETYDLFGRFTTGAPSVIGASDGNEYIFITGEDRRLYYRTRVSGTLGPWQEVPGGGLSPSGPGVAEYRGALYLYVRGTDNQLYYTTLTLSTGAWLGYWVWMPAPTYAYSPPYGVIDSPGVLSTRFEGYNYVDEDLTVFVRGPSNRLFTNTFKYRTWIDPYAPYQAWAGWTLLTGSSASAPRAVARPSGNGYVFTRTADGTLEMRQYINCGGDVLGGCFTAETPVPNAPLTSSEPGTISFESSYWLMVRGKADDIVYYVNGNDQGGFDGSWSALHSGRSFAGPTGSVQDGIWWLYTTGADGRVNRY